MEESAMTLIEIYVIGLAVILLLMTLLWLVSLRLKNSSIVDIFWGAGFVLAAWLYFGLTPNGFLPRKLLIAGLATLWGLRLSIHILRRNWGKPEDFRYAKWRSEAGAKWWWQSYPRVFLQQGVLLWIISMPLLAAQFGTAPARITWLDVLGVLVWLVGFGFEAAGDAQLAGFVADPANRGKVMDRGVWRFTRHPNYFGDAAQWWGFYLIAAAAGGWWAFYSPALMTYLLVFVSGVALLEKKMMQRPAYREYARYTNAFVPWFPHKK